MENHRDTPLYALYGYLVDVFVLNRIKLGRVVEAIGSSCCQGRHAEAASRTCHPATPELLSDVVPLVRWRSWLYYQWFLMDAKCCRITCTLSQRTNNRTGLNTICVGEHARLKIVVTKDFCY